MNCPSTLLGPELYYAAILFIVGGLVRAAKRLPFVPPDALPALAFALGWAIDGAIGNGLCGESYTGAAMSALAGGLAGLGAAGGHEALMRTARAVGLEDRAAGLLGRAKAEADKPKPASKPPSSAALLILLALATPGCAGLLPALMQAAQGAQFLGTVIDVASSGADAYFARHPSQESEARVEAAVRGARVALAALDAALAKSGAAKSPEAVTARRDALAAYSELRSTLDGLGILSATPPEGGAESEAAPKPEPFDIPTPDAVSATL